MKKKFNKRVIKNLDGLLREAMKFPSLEILKSSLDGTTSNLTVSELTQCRVGGCIG